VDVESLVVYGHRISNTMGEAPYYTPEEQTFYETTMFFKAPFPDETSIQRSRLYTGIFEEEKPEEVAESPEEPREEESKFLEIERVKPTDGAKPTSVTEQPTDFDDLTF